MRILVLIHEYPPVGGGGGRVAQDLCRGFVAHGHEVRVLTAHLDDLTELDSSEGFQVIRLRSGRTQAFKASLTAMMGYVAASTLAGLKMFRTWKPDVIHVHFAVPAGAAALALSKLSGVPYVLTAHLGDVPGGTPEKTGRWFRWVFPFTPPIWKSAARVVAVSEFTRQLARKSYQVDPLVIPNGVDLRLQAECQVHAGQPPLVVFAGRFMDQKNPVQVVHILNEVRDLFWHCAMLGDGPLRPQVEDEIQRLGLKDRFTLTGWIEPEQVQNWFARADILLMPSLSEGLPVVGVQALAAGLAVVAGRVGGFIDLVEQGQNGYLFDPQDAPAFAEALRGLLSDSNRLQTFRKCSQRLAVRFDLARVVQSYVHLFEGLGK